MSVPAESRSRFMFLIFFLVLFFVVAGDARAATCPAIGNMQKSNDDSATQNNPKITYDTFTDARVNDFHRGSPVQTVLEFYSYTWSWAPDKLLARFQLAKNYASKTDYVSFLMDEELVQPASSWWYAGWRPGFVGAPGFSSSYGVRNFEGVSVDYGAGSAAFYLQLLKAWKQLCINIGKKCAMLGDAQSDSSFYATMYGSAGVDYIAQNFDMIYLYSYPSTVSQANCGSGICAKSKIDFWRGKGFTGKINYILTNEQFGAGSDAVVEADFKNAADNGADIISAYPYKHSGDTLATARMISIWDAYVAAGCTPGPSITPTPGPCTPTKTCADYPNQCGMNLFNGCSNTLDCSGACFAPTACNTATWICEVPVSPPPVAPTVISNCVTKAVELRWNISAGLISGYNIYRDNVLIATNIKGLYYRDVPGDYNSHDYQVSAINSAGEGPRSVIVAQAACIPAVAHVKKYIAIGDFKQLVANIFKWSLSIIGGLALLMIIIGGMMYMGATGSEQGIVTARKTITYAIAGLVLVLMGYIISSVIEKIFT